MGAELLCTDRYNDVYHHLVGGLCLYKEEPVIVRNSDKHRVQIAHLNDPFLVETVDYRVKEFRYNSPPLGYFNAKKDALYLQRSAKETSFHALRPDYLIALPGGWGVLYDENPEWFTSKAMGDCIKGKHPSFQEVLNSLREEEAESRAFHRHYALKHKARNTFSLVKRGLEEIGLVRDNRLIIYESRHKNIVETLIKGAEDINVSTL